MDKKDPSKIPEINNTISNNSNNVYCDNADNDDWFCQHEEFPFCDCLANFAKHGNEFSVTTYNCPLNYLCSGERKPYTQNQQLSRNPEATYYISDNAVTSTVGCKTRNSILEVLEEDDENDSEVEGAVGGEIKPVPGHCLLSGAPSVQRRASIITSDSRKSPLTPQSEPIRVAVFGKDGVGKSALIVRLVTGRFIGEYDPSMEAIYSYQIPLYGHDLPLQVMDTAGTVDVSEEGRERQVSWGEGFMLVFSLTNHSSLSALQHIRRVLIELTPGSPRPLILVGNKADLSQAREVTTKEILDLTDLWGCDYFEVSAAEPWDVVVRPFLAIYQAVLEARRS
ncbi:UNVERIFIED_CONTAM: hypothetical protein RMT77_012423 [Armadillidium vulgare]